jgi:hypothetical protein
MQFSATVLPLLALALPTSAIITGVTAPSSITAGSPFILTLNTADYIQAVYDVSVAFGISPGEGHGGSLGDVFASAYLGPPLSNILNPIRFTVIVDGSTPKGEAVIAAAVTSLYGIGAEPALNTFNTTVTVV